MIKYSENDLYDRCGYDTNLISDDIIRFTGEFYVMNNEVKIPIMKNVMVKDGLSRHLVLKTHKGYICVDRITEFTDIFDDSKYLRDETVWIHPYLYQKNPSYYESITKLAITLGKHWQGNNDQDNKKMVKQYKKGFNN